MKNTHIIISITLLVLTSCAEKTAWVKTETIFAEYEPLVSLKEDFAAESESLLKDLELQIEAYGIKERQFRNNEQSYTATKRKTQREALLNEAQLLQQERNKRSAELQVKSQRQIDSLIASVKAQIVEYGVTNRYDYIYGQNDAGSVLYGAISRDITKEVLEFLNSKK